MTDTDVRRLEDKVDQAIVTLARLEGSLSPTLKNLADGQTDLNKDIVEHKTVTSKRLEKIEDRIGGLERFRYSIPSVALLGLVVSIGVLAYYLTHSP